LIKVFILHLPEYIRIKVEGFFILDNTSLGVLTHFSSSLGVALDFIIVYTFIFDNLSLSLDIITLFLYMHDIIRYQPKAINAEESSSALRVWTLMEVPLHIIKRKAQGFVEIMSHKLGKRKWLQLL